MKRILVLAMICLLLTSCSNNNQYTTLPGDDLTPNPNETLYNLHQIDRELTFTKDEYGSYLELYNVKVSECKGSFIVRTPGMEVNFETLIKYDIDYEISEKYANESIFVVNYFVLLNYHILQQVTYVPQNPFYHTLYFEIVPYDSPYF